MREGKGEHKNPLRKDEMCKKSHKHTEEKGRKTECPLASTTNFSTLVICESSTKHSEKYIYARVFTFFFSTFQENRLKVKQNFRKKKIKEWVITCIVFTLKNTDKV